MTGTEDKSGKTEGIQCIRCGASLDGDPLKYDMIYCFPCLPKAISKTLAGQKACLKGAQGGLFYSYMLSFMTFQFAVLDGLPNIWSVTEALSVSLLGSLLWLSLAFVLGSRASHRAAEECEIDSDELFMCKVTKAKICRNLALRCLPIALAFYALTRLGFWLLGYGNWHRLLRHPPTMIFVAGCLYVTLFLTARKSVDVMIGSLRTELFRDVNE
ncbi:MAG: hypothetical protein P1V97_27205 [Planctomycetota bacterium]|nr:hypothetical protein [Planctomycetota bacterium]